VERTYSSSEQQAINMVQVILPILIALLILIFIAGFLFTAGLTRETLIAFMIMVILAVVVIGIITTTEFA
jgi:hypothetical protein